MNIAEKSNILIKGTDVQDKMMPDFVYKSQTLFGATSNLISSKRKHALASFYRLGFPNKKNEEYKYTDIDAIIKKNFSKAITTAISTASSITEAEIESLLIDNNSIIAVIVNGVFSEKLSKINKLPKGFFIGSLAEACVSKKEIIEKHFATSTDEQADGLVALNTALASDGVFIHISKGIKVEIPIHIITIISSVENIFVQPRNLIVIEEQAEVKIMESFESIDLNAKSFTNSVTEIFVGENAKLESYKIQKESSDAYQINTTQVHQKKNSLFNTHTITLDGALVRNNLNVVLDDQNCEAHLFGLYLLKGNQQVDNHTLVDHRKPNCFSNELYKGIMEDKSKGGFNGKIFVRQDAQKTNAFQSNKNILMSDEASINTKPQLEIYANDVKCSHGTSTGKLDEEALFYLRSRGIGEQRAKKLLMYAFAQDIINSIKIEELKDFVKKRVEKRLE